MRAVAEGLGSQTLTVQMLSKVRVKVRRLRIRRRRRDRHHLAEAERPRSSGCAANAVRPSAAHHRAQRPVHASRFKQPSRRSLPGHLHPERRSRRAVYVQHRSHPMKLLPRRHRARRHRRPRPPGGRLGAPVGLPHLRQRRSRTSTRSRATPVETRGAGPLPRRSTTATPFILTGRTTSSTRRRPATSPDRNRGVVGYNLIPGAWREDGPGKDPSPSPRS